MALGRPNRFPEEHWLPVIAAEAQARLTLLAALNGIPWRRAGYSKYCDWDAVRRATFEYVSAVVAAFAFAEQACEAARNRKIPAVALDQTVENFIEIALAQAYSGLHSEKIKETWSVHGLGGMKFELRPQIMSAAWYLTYLAEVPDILQAFSTRSEDADVNSPEQVRRAFVMPKLTNKGLSVPKWAKAAGVSQAIAYDYLGGKTDLRPENRKALAEVLGVDPAELP
jgi:hypothetical protein